MADFNDPNAPNFRPLTDEEEQEAAELRAQFEAKQGEEKPETEEHP